jgi:hypothetical protein
VGNNDNAIGEPEGSYGSMQSEHSSPPHSVTPDYDYTRPRGATGYGWINSRLR